MPKRKFSVQLSDVKLLLELAQEGLRGIGIPGLEALPGVPLKLIDYFEAITDNTHDLDDLASTLETLQRIVISPIEEARQHGHRYVPELAERVNQLIQRLNVMEGKLSSFVDLGRWKCFRKKDEITAILREVNRDLNRSISQFKLRGQITVELQLWDLASERMPLYFIFSPWSISDSMDQTLKGLLNTLHPANARFDASEKRPCLPNTRSVLLDTLRNHLHHSPHTFVCLYGSPGTGKSAIAKSVAAEFHRDERLAASYFFDKRGGDAGNISLSTFVSTLVYQLARYSLDFHTALSRQLERDPLLADATADIRLRELLIEPLRSLSVGKSAHRWIIVLDALDECGDGDHQQRLMNLLRECAELEEHVVFLLTCRPEAGITRVLQGRRIARHAVVESMDELDRTETLNDIHAFVNARLREMQPAEQPSFIPPVEDILQFAASCGGLFEIAAVRLREIARNSRYFPLRRAFAAALEAAQEDSSSVCPLHEVYSNILSAAYDVSGSLHIQKSLLTLHHSLVGALTSLRQPLPMAPLAALVGIEEDEARQALEPLSSLIAVPKGDGPVHFYHTSFLEYLTSGPRGHFSDRPAILKYLVHPAQCDAALAERSLITMNNLLRRNILQLSSTPIFNDKIPQLSPILSQHVPVHLRYACVHWASHLRCDDALALRCREPLVAWCLNKIPAYFEVLSLMGGLERVVDLLNEARIWARKIGDLEASATLLNDALRMAQMFFPALARSATSIYLSALPLMPTCALSAQYADLASRRTSVLRGRLSTWPAQVWVHSFPRSVICAAFSPNGRHIASGTRDGLITILSVGTGKLEQVLKGHRGTVHSVAFSPDSTLVASGSEDGSVRVWSLATGEEEMQLDVHNGAVYSVAFSPDGARLVSGSQDRTLRVWSVSSGEPERVIKWHRLAVRSVAVSPDGAYIASGSDDHCLSIWCLATGKRIRELKGHQKSVCSVAFSPDGKHVASGSEGTLVCVWSVATGEQERALEGHTGAIRSVAFSPDGLHIISGSMDNSIRVWSAITGEQQYSLDRHSDCVYSVAVSPDSAHIVSGSHDCSVRLWSLTTGKEKRREEGHCHDVINITCSPDGRFVRTSDALNRVLFWDTVTRTNVNPVQIVAKGFEFEWQSPKDFIRPRDDWLRLKDHSIWLPGYMTGVCWMWERVVVVRSADYPERLALIDFSVPK